MNCKNCSTELTQMTNAAGEPTCMRCLKCHPLPVEMKPEQKKKDEPRYVDVPWTEERIRNIVVDELENWHKMTTVNDGDMTLTEVAVPDELIKPKVVVAGGGEIPENVEIPDSPPKWTDQAESLGISWRGRKKIEVLDEIEAKLEIPA